MSVDMVAGLAGDKYTTEINRMKMSNHSPSAVSMAPKTQGIMDQFQVSESAKLAYEQENNTGLMDKFRLALIRFSNYALHYFGNKPEAGPDEAYVGLLELARLAQVDAPVDLGTQESKEALLAAFQDKWGFDEESSIDDIFHMMVTEFQKGQATDENRQPIFASAGDEVNDFIAPSIQSSGEAESEGERPQVTLMNKCRAALDAFAEKIFGQEPPSGADADILDVLAEKLGLNGDLSEMNPADIFRKAGITAGNTIDEIVTLMGRLYYR